MRHLGESEKTKKKIRFPIHTIINTLPFGEPSHFWGHQGQMPVKLTYGLGCLREGRSAIHTCLAWLGLSPLISLCRKSRWAGQPLLAKQCSTVAMH